MSARVNEDEGGGGSSLIATSGVASSSLLLLGRHVMDTSACSALHDETDELQWIADSFHEQSAASAAVRSSWADLNHLASWTSHHSHARHCRHTPMQRSILNMDLSYEDFSKNMDANLAQIDMETFRSEDINHAILSLQSARAGVGEECASLSGSLIDDLPIDSSQRVNEICRKTPLFSPLKEASVPSASHILMADSLDCSYHGDLVLTCRATNKNNYTLAFEQSQIIHPDGASEDSELAGSSEAQSNWSGSENANDKSGCATTGRGDASVAGSKSGMVHSEFAFTTWSRVSSDGREDSGKSHSLPDLLKRSMTKSVLQKTCNTLYTINDCQVIEDRRSGVPLLRMFMDKGGRGSQEVMHCSSSTTETQNGCRAGSALGGTGNKEANPCQGGHTRISSGQFPGEKDDPMDGSFTLPLTTLPIFNARSSNVSQAQELLSANAVTNVHQVRARQKLDNTLNNNTVILDDSTTLSEEDGSQCFEDSLVGLLAARRGFTCPGVSATATALTSPIREEDEQCLGSASSCDEPMRDVGTNSSTNSSGSNSTGNDSNNPSPPYDSKPLPKINNFVGQRVSPARRGELVGSESSGYISRQNSNDQINKSPNAQQFLLCAGNRRSTPKMGSLQCSTQVRTVAIQTGPPSPTPHTGTEEPDCHVVTPEQLLDPQSTPINKSIYVCYPNYSLPDLSFLKDIKPGHAVVLQPTEIGQTTKLPAQTPPAKESVTQHMNLVAAVGTPARRRAQSSGPKCRPKSYNDCEATLRTGVERIKDWESLSLLLPDDIKLMVKQMRGEVQAAQAAQTTTATAAAAGVPGSIRMREKDSGSRQPRPLRIDQIAGTYEEVYISGGAGVHIDERDGSSLRRHSLLNLPSLTGLIPTGLDLNTVATPQQTFTQQTNSNSSSSNCCCRGTKKAVSFSDNLCKGLSSDHRTPATCGCRNFALNLQDCMTPTPGSIASGGSRGFAGIAMGMPFREHTPQGLSPSGFVSPLTHSQHELVTAKRHLLDSIYTAIRQVVDAYGRDKERDAKMQLLSDDSEAGREVSRGLLPALERLLEDGLLPHVRGLFGPLPNSKWHLVESMVQTKEGRKEVRELLDYIHSVNAALDEGAKFRCFALGLVNLGCLDAWITLLLATASVQHKHYQTSAFLPLLSHYSFFFLQEELVSNLRVLSELPFAFNLNMAAKLRPHQQGTKGRARPVSYPAAVKKEPEPPKKDTQKFRQLRNQWEKMSGLALPNRQHQQPITATTVPSTTGAAGAASNPRVHQADNLRSNRHSQPAARHLPAQKTQSSPQRGFSATTAKRNASTASSVASTASTVKASSAGSERDPNSVVLVRKSLIPIRGWSSKGTVHQDRAHGKAK
ncbi:uncharacterized protein LOC111258799 isoform X3 [Varroa jacobsoni]|uniref:RUN domain-containing protein n=1 Tax=Varroa destructor TaxID=109461 RepID=A0A7M7K3I2_VARDE|nr:uncharacterized protein LOC111250310 isoform X3 [Varroa destructor]XP_022686072.1 uncharacterized protein LOC111258799 isoform X3 [Varroa jacobsoni]